MILADALSASFVSRRVVNPCSPTSASVPNRWPADWPFSGGLFDVPGKRASRDKLEAKQSEPTFWENQTEAQKVIQQIRALNATVKPYEELTKAGEELAVMAELAGEDAAFEVEMEEVLDKAETQLDEFELKAMMSGKQDGASAIVSIKPGAGGTEACDWAQMLYRMYTRWAQRHGFTVAFNARICWITFWASV